MSIPTGILALSRELEAAWLRAEAASAPDDCDGELVAIAMKLGEAKEILHHYEERLYAALHKEER